MPLGPRVYGIDYCIVRIVASLNAGGVKTLESRCGHGSPTPGEIILEDGRALIIRHWSQDAGGPITLDDTPRSSSSNHRDSGPEFDGQPPMHHGRCNGSLKQYDFQGSATDGRFQE